MRSKNYVFSAIAGMAIAIASAGPAPAAQEHIDFIVSSCQSDLGHSASRCACFGETAAADLSDKQQAFVVAQITRDQASISRLQGSMSINEMTGAAQFMAGIEQTCR